LEFDLKKLRLMIFSLFMISLASANSNEEKIKNVQDLKTIAFGSCNSQFHHQPLWRELLAIAPDLFIWGGDNIYADTVRPEEISEAYKLQNSNQEYRLFKSMTPIIGTWDDHDFAHNNATGTFKEKLISKDYFLDFLEEPKDSRRRAQEGIYTSYTFNDGGKKIKFLLLDNRYFKGLEKSAPMLGETQWKWLEKELTNSNANLHFIVSGLSILSPVLKVSEEWADFPSELQRFLNLLKKTSPSGVVILSGDKHFSSIFKRHGHLEFLSSGMTHTASQAVRPYLNSKYSNTFFGLSFGHIQIDWVDDTPVLSMSVRSTSGKIFLPKKFMLLNNEWKEIKE